MARVTSANAVEPGSPGTLLLSERERLSARDCHPGHALIGVSVLAFDHRRDPFLDRPTSHHEPAGALGRRRGMPRDGSGKQTRGQQLVAVDRAEARIDQRLLDVAVKRRLEVVTSIDPAVDVDLVERARSRDSSSFRNGPSPSELRPIARALLNVAVPPGVRFVDP